MKQESMGLEEFQERFSTEDACREHLFEIRWPVGYSCPRCGHDRYYPHGPRHLYDCKKCRYPVSLTAGTIFQTTKISLRTWFSMIFLMVQPKSHVSMLCLQRMLKIKSYKTAWMMAHKIRIAMAGRDAYNKPAGLAEEDQPFDRLLRACLSTPAITFSQLRRRS